MATVGRLLDIDDRRPSAQEAVPTQRIIFHEPAVAITASLVRDPDPNRSRASPQLSADAGVFHPLQGEETFNLDWWQNLFAPYLSRVHRDYDDRTRYPFICDELAGLMERFWKLQCACESLEDMTSKDAMFQEILRQMSDVITQFMANGENASFSEDHPQVTVRKTPSKRALRETEPIDVSRYASMSRTHTERHDVNYERMDRATRVLHAMNFASALLHSYDRYKEILAFRLSSLHRVVQSRKFILQRSSRTGHIAEIRHASDDAMVRRKCPNFMYHDLLIFEALHSAPSSTALNVGHTAGGSSESMRVSGSTVGTSLPLHRAGSSRARGLHTDDGSHVLRSDPEEETRYALWKSLLHEMRARQHWLSLSQLRFGTLVGDALGLPPILAIMLCPWGGLFCPSTNGELSARHVENWVTGWPSPKHGYSARHAVTHTACGYLYVFHQVGPGFHYTRPLDASRLARGKKSSKVQQRKLQELSRLPSDPRAGNRNGLKYWASQSIMSRWLVHTPFL